MEMLSLSFRIILFVGSIVVFLLISRCVRKRQIQMKDGIFWIVFGLLLILVAAFPGLGVLAARVFGVQTPANFVFLIVIFLLGCHQFLLTIKVSQLDKRNKKLTQDIAIQRTLEKEEHR